VTRVKNAKGHFAPKTLADALQRLATEVVEDPETGCLVWQGSKTAQGYGDLRFDHKHKLAHRLAYENAKGPIPEGLYIDHLCRRRDCINPDHLEPVTHAENLKRARKDRCFRGHRRSGDNLYISPLRGLRQCRECNRIRGAAYRERRRCG
jgi:hypothetical protein